MPDTPIATLYTDAASGKQPRLRQDEKGRWLSTTYWRINTAREGRAAGALNLPTWGDPYFDAEVLAFAPGLKCVGKEIFHTHGSDDATTQVGGYSEAVVEYAQPEASGSTPLPLPGQKWTDFRATTSAQNALYDIRRNPIGGTAVQMGPFTPSGSVDKPIAGGRGTSKDFGALHAVVTVDMTAAQLAAILPKVSSLIFEQTVNGANLTLPPLLGASTPYAIEKWKAQYHDFDYDVAGSGVYRVRHVLKLVPVNVRALDGYNGEFIDLPMAAFSAYLLEDDKGNGFSEPIGVQLYKIGAADGQDFEGLW